MPNRLAAEKSPYLLQHANNPVDWYPWGDEAFGRARTEDKPIFLSIGYSTCHWCHVMEHESFENADDRRGAQPRLRLDQGRSRGAAGRRSRLHDVRAGDDGLGRLADERLADARPASRFSAARTFRRTSRWGSPGSSTCCSRSRGSWQDDREQRDVASAANSTERLRERGRAARRRGDVPARRARSTTRVAQFRASFDRARGGFGDAPKFPRPSELLFLFREHARTGDSEARATWRCTRCARWRSAACATTSAAAFIAIRSTRDWRVPHFEKMLYDQAQLVLAYLEAAQITGDPFFAAVADDTLEYVRAR